MHDQNKLGIENICRELLNASQGVLSWKWDSRFETALAEFTVGNKESVNAILERCLKIVWNSTNIDNAPELVRMVISHFGGLRPGQLLFTSDPNQDAFMYGVWWPWGDGETFSIRVAPADKTLSVSESAELITLFKGWFGL